MTVVLSRHTAGDVIRYSELFPTVRALGISVERVAEVLTAMGVLIDDRRPSFEAWLKRKLDGLGDGIRAETEHWLRTLHQGGPRTKARKGGHRLGSHEQRPAHPPDLVTAL
ncbi:hypothetical protein [Nonomuraea solani]|uniref:hypothetical protein n=1 Tax=Nonomuraea solani TaxID=1144553 RepID=UPI00135C4538|nr:hypothetical protein [Nonomuraea solani]